MLRARRGHGTPGILPVRDSPAPLRTPSPFSEDLGFPLGRASAGHEFSRAPQPMLRNDSLEQGHHSENQANDQMPNCSSDSVIRCMSLVITKK